MSKDPDENVANKLSSMGVKMSQVAWECEENSNGNVPTGKLCFHKLKDNVNDYSVSTSGQWQAGEIEKS